MYPSSQLDYSILWGARRLCTVTNFMHFVTLCAQLYDKSLPKSEIKSNEISTRFLGCRSLSSLGSISSINSGAGYSNWVGFPKSRRQRVTSVNSQSHVIKHLLQPDHRNGKFGHRIWTCRRVNHYQPVLVQHSGLNILGIWGNVVKRIRLSHLTRCAFSVGHCPTPSLILS